LPEGGRLSGPRHGWGSATLLTTATLTAQTNNTREVFAIGFRRRSGHSPNLAAQQIYDAIRLVAAGLRTAGANRARLRDQLAKGNTFQGISGEILFDSAGNNLQDVRLINSRP